MNFSLETLDEAISALNYVINRTSNLERVEKLEDALKAFEETRDYFYKSEGI